MPASLTNALVTPTVRTEVDRFLRGAVTLNVVLRVGNAVVLLAAFGFILAEPRVPDSVGFAALATLAFSALNAFTALRRGRLSSQPWGVADLALGLGMLAFCSRLVPADLLLGSWFHWSPGYLAISAAFVASWLSRRRDVLGIGLLIATTYAITTVPSVDDAALAIVANGSSYIVFALAGWYFSQVGLELAHRADAAHAAALESAAQLEAARFAIQVHTASGLLETLAITESTDPNAVSLRKRAAREANRLRFEVLRGHSAVNASQALTLEEVVWAGCEGFTHLPLNPVLGLGRSAPVTASHATATRDALGALLDNAERHSRASAITIHADQDDSSWTLQVCDDGVGFVVDDSTFGFGLRNQVVGRPTDLGLEVTVTSHPGEGSCVTIAGPKAL